LRHLGQVFWAQGRHPGLGLAIHSLFFLVVLFIGIVIFNRVEKTFNDTV
jgi:hypothetical protein